MLHISEEFYKRLAGWIKESAEDNVSYILDEYDEKVNYECNLEVTGKETVGYIPGVYGMYDAKREVEWELKDFDITGLHFWSDWDGSEIKTDFDKSKIKQYL